MKTQFTRRQWLQCGATGTGVATLATLTGCEKRETPPPAGSAAAAALSRSHANEQYVWLSAHANLPLFTRHDHPALRLAAEELGVQAVVAGPDALDISALVAAVEQTTAQKPAGMMVVGWDRSALVPTINAAIERGIPVICVDADVPASKRLCFVGTDWFEIGVRQAEAMGRALQGRRGKVALMGLVDQEINQRAFDGFRSVTAKLGLECLEPQHDKGNTSEATHVAAAIIQGTPELVGYRRVRFGERPGHRPGGEGSPSRGTDHLHLRGCRGSPPASAQRGRPDGVHWPETRAVHLSGAADLVRSEPQPSAAHQG
jgi:ABC-type sugar transport system substrate-binding protein